MFSGLFNTLEGSIITFQTYQKEGSMLKEISSLVLRHNHSVLLNYERDLNMSRQRMAVFEDCQATKLTILPP